MNKIAPAPRKTGENEMTIKVFTHCYSFMRKDYRALNAVFTILALYLVADEFYTYY